MTFWSQLGFVFGKFPFVGWTRGWYSEDTENNYEMMTAESIITNNKVSLEKTKTKTKTKDSTSNIFYQDIIKTMISAVEMSMLVKLHKYDENVIATYNTIINSNSVT